MQTVELERNLRALAQLIHLRAQTSSLRWHMEPFDCECRLSDSFESTQQAVEIYNMIDIRIVNAVCIY